MNAVNQNSYNQASLITLPNDILQEVLFPLLNFRDVQALACVSKNFSLITLRGCDQLNSEYFQSLQQKPLFIRLLYTNTSEISYVQTLINSDNFPCRKVVSLELDKKGKSKEDYEYTLYEFRFHQLVIKKLSNLLKLKSGYLIPLDGNAITLAKSVSHIKSLEFHAASKMHFKDMGSSNVTYYGKPSPQRGGVLRKSTRDQEAL